MKNRDGKSPNTLVTILTVTRSSEKAKYDALLAGSGYIYLWKGGEHEAYLDDTHVTPEWTRLQVPWHQADAVVELVTPVLEAEQAYQAERIMYHKGMRYKRQSGYCPSCDSYGLYVEHGSWLKRVSNYFGQKQMWCKDCDHLWTGKITGDSID